MAATPDVRAILEAQRAYFASDEHLAERGVLEPAPIPEDTLAIREALRRSAR
jgi:hypothetical protein